MIKKISLNKEYQELEQIHYNNTEDTNTKSLIKLENKNIIVEEPVSNIVFTFPLIQKIDDKPIIENTIGEEYFFSTFYDDDYMENK